MLKKNNIQIVKNQVITSIMKNGKKRTGEKILLKLSKSLQKATQKNFQSLLQLAIINSTPAFKLNEQIMKKGKRKSKKIVPSFITKDSLRVMGALKSIKNVAQKSKNSSNFFDKWAKEILDTSSAKSQSVEQKINLQNQVLLNKRYLAKFRW